MLPSWVGLPFDQPMCCTQAPGGRGPQEIEREGSTVSAPPTAAGLASLSKGAAAAKSADGPARQWRPLLPAALPVGPQEVTARSFSIQGARSLEDGDPLHSGKILQIILGENIQEVKLSLFDQGFSIASPPTLAACGKQQLISRFWSPFTLVEKCQVKAMENADNWAVFKFTLFRREGLDLSYYFACTGKGAKKERETWVEATTSAVINLTMSLFPSHTIVVQPIPGKETTYSRIMAGYMLRGGSADEVTLVYCELHTYCGGEAQIILYQDEWCEHEVLRVRLSDKSAVSTRKGCYCTVFGVDSHRFCCRTREERDLWLRAVSNVKVKLMFGAPDPSADDLATFRAAVGERLEALPPLPPPREGTSGVDPDSGGVTSIGRPAEEDKQDYTSPMLARVPRRPPPGPAGDAVDPPEPFDDDIQGLLAAEVSPTAAAAIAEEIAASLPYLASDEACSPANESCKAKAHESFQQPLAAAAAPEGEPVGLPAAALVEPPAGAPSGSFAALGAGAPSGSFAALGAGGHGGTPQELPRIRLESAGVETPRTSLRQHAI